MKITGENDNAADGVTGKEVITEDESSEFAKYLEDLLEVPSDQKGTVQETVWGKEEEQIRAAEEYLSKYPSGFRFQPTDEELLMGFLARKVKNEPLPINRIRSVLLYNYRPDALVETYYGENRGAQREKEYYFFTLIEGKYGKRPKRSAGDGYWRASGADKTITSNGEVIGFRKALDFYTGKQQPGGTKTHWKMHEYRLPEAAYASNNKMNGWVLCKVYTFRGESKKNDFNHDGDGVGDGGRKRRRMEVDHDHHGELIDWFFHV